MIDEALELTTDDLLIEEDVEPPQRGLPPARGRSDISVTSAAPKARAVEPAAVARRPSVLTRPIKERSRSRPSQEQKVEEGPANLAVKAAAFFEEAQEAERAGDAKAAIRHVKLAITFNPHEPRYQELLTKLAR